MLPAILLLASCGGSEDRTALPAKQAGPETGAAAQVGRLDEGQRNMVFEKAIRASGATCLHVAGSERAELMGGAKGWKAQCQDGRYHLIEILPDGTAKVTSRVD